MIGYIRGKIVQRWNTGVVVDVNGVGYEVQMPSSMASALSPSSEDATLHTHLVWREDTVALYGFDSTETRDMFRLLLEVSGVGPRVALNILSMLSTTELIEILARGENKRLQSVHGVGKKTAARLCVDLRERAKDILRGRGAPAGFEAMENETGRPMDDALSALENLGYKTGEALDALVRAGRELGEQAGVEALVKGALRLLSGRKRK